MEEYILFITATTMMTYLGVNFFKCAWFYRHKIVNLYYYR